MIKRYVLEAKQDLAFAETKPNQIKAKHGHCCGVCSLPVSLFETIRPGVCAASPAHWVYSDLHTGVA